MEDIDLPVAASNNGNQTSFSWLNRTFAVGDGINKDNYVKTKSPQQLNAIMSKKRNYFRCLSLSIKSFPYII